MQIRPPDLGSPPTASTFIPLDARVATEDRELRKSIVEGQGPLVDRTEPNRHLPMLSRLRGLLEELERRRVQREESTEP